MRLTKTLHRTIARCEQETIERWLHSSIYELYEKQYNKLDIRQISQFLDCQYIYNDPESKPEEGAHYTIESARRRIVQLMNIQGTTDSILLNHQAAYLLLLHPTTLDPLAKLEASNLQARLNATQKFATQAPKEARWLRKITVHRALLAQEAIRSVIGIQEHLELQRATPFPPTKCLPITSWASMGKWHTNTGHHFRANIPISNILTTRSTENELVACLFDISSQNPTIKPLQTIFHKVSNDDSESSLGTIPLQEG